MLHRARHGWIEVVAGVMFSGKSEELIRRVRRALIARRRVQLFKSHLDDRYGGRFRISTHDGRQLDAEPVSTSVQVAVKVDPATRNQRLIDGAPAPVEGPTIHVGGSESYGARCRGCHEVPQRDRAQRELLPPSAIRAPTPPKGRA